MRLEHMENPACRRIGRGTPAANIWPYILQQRMKVFSVFGADFAFLVTVAIFVESCLVMLSFHAFASTTCTRQDQIATIARAINALCTA